MEVTKRRVLVSLGLLLAGGVFALGAVDDLDAGEDTPVFFVVLETTRADHVGRCYGHSRNATPEICSVAEDGVLFENAYSQGSATGLSTPSLFKSIYPHSSGTMHSYPDARPFTEIMKSNGYDTYRLNYFPVVEERQGMNLTRIRSLPGGKERWLTVWFNRWLVHSPYLVGKEYLEGVDNRSLQELQEMRNINGSPVHEWRRWKEDQSPELLKKLYDSELRVADSRLGEYFEQLKSKGLYKESLIVITSDHGEGFGEHGLKAWHGGKPYSEVTHVPLIVKLPGNRYAGTRVEQPVRHIDIAPTMLDILNIPHGEMAGSSLMPAIRGKDMDLPVISVGDGWRVLRDDEFAYFSNRTCGSNSQSGQYFVCSRENGSWKCGGADKSKDWIEESRQKLCKLTTRENTEEKEELSERAKERLRKLGYLS